MFFFLHLGPKNKEDHTKAAVLPFPPLCKTWRYFERQKEKNDEEITRSILFFSLMPQWLFLLLSITISQWIITTIFFINNKKVFIVTSWITIDE